MTTRPRPGALPAWQRRATYLALSICATSGVVWFVMIDVFALQPDETHGWWIAHGVSAVLSTLCIGGAIGQHVQTNWRLGKARVTGAANLASLALLIASSFYLMYGGNEARDLVHWLHVAVGLAAVLLFVGHIVRGRRVVASRRAAAT